jgi:hypothetical protein
MVATGSDIKRKYSSVIELDSLSYVVKLAVYSHSFGNITFIIQGFPSPSFVNLKPSFDLMFRTCDNICLPHTGIVADQSNIIPFAHSWVPNFTFSNAFNFLLFAYMLTIAALGVTFMDNVFSPSKIHLSFLFELLTVKWTR